MGAEFSDGVRSLCNMAQVRDDANRDLHSGNSNLKMKDIIIP